MGTSGNPATRAAQKSEAPAPVTFDRLAAKKPATSTMYIPLDDVVRQRFEDAAQELAFWKIQSDDKKRAEVQAKFDQAEAEFRNPENSVRVDFKALGRVRFDKLRNEHPPTDDQAAKAKEDGESIDWNTESFMAPLIAETVVSPKMTADQVRSLTKAEDDGGYGWTQGDIETLFNEAVRINLATRIGPYSF